MRLASPFNRISRATIVLPTPKNQRNHRVTLSMACWFEHSLENWIPVRDLVLFLFSSQWFQKLKLQAPHIRNSLRYQSKKLSASGLDSRKKWARKAVPHGKPGLFCQASHVQIIALFFAASGKLAPRFFALTVDDSANGNSASSPSMRVVRKFSKLSAVRLSGMIQTPTRVPYCWASSTKPASGILPGTIVPVCSSRNLTAFQVFWGDELASNANPTERLLLNRTACSTPLNKSSLPSFDSISGIRPATAFLRSQCPAG